MRYGTSTTLLSSTAGIVDTRTTLILIATDALTKYASATGLLCITFTQYSNLRSLFFTTNGLTANAQLWSRSLNTYIGRTAGRIYLIVDDLASPSGGRGLDFINGYALKGFTRFSTPLEFATTPYTTSIRPRKEG